MIKVIPEKPRAHTIKYQRFFLLLLFFTKIKCKSKNLLHNVFRVII